MIKVTITDSFIVDDTIKVNNQITISTAYTSTDIHKLTDEIINTIYKYDRHTHDKKVKTV